MAFWLSTFSQVLHETFPQHTFLMNGLIQGVKVKIVLLLFPTTWLASCAKFICTGTRAMPYLERLDNLWTFLCVNYMLCWYLLQWLTPQFWSCIDFLADEMSSNKKHMYVCMYVYVCVCDRACCLLWVPRWLVPCQTYGAGSPSCCWPCSSPVPPSRWWG